jgi:hypothetical protein
VILVEAQEAALSKAMAPCVVDLVEEKAMNKTTPPKRKGA